jgi:hypothetical protein
MTRLTRLTAFGLLLVAAGCRTCDDRPRPLARLRDALDRDDHARDRIAPTRNDASPRLGDPCAPCAGGMPTYAGTVLGGSYGGTVIGAPMGLTSGPMMGTPIYPSGPGTMLPQPGSFAPRDNELPAPGGYSQPNPADMGRGKSPATGGLAGK